jgi:acetoin utilization deacetylase AcuC-like enzyme
MLCAYIKHPTSRRQVEADYAWLTRQIVAVAERHARGKIVSVLEGGTTLPRWRARLECIFGC